MMVEDALRGLELVEAELPAERGDRRGAPPPVELHARRRGNLRVEAAEHHVGVGHGRARAAAAIGGRAGPRAGALRPDAERAAGIDIGDRAAARADRVDVDHRHQQRDSRRSRVSRAVASANRPSTTMPMSALVPPISKVISFVAPGERARPGAAENAGGEARQQRQRPASRRPSRAVATPPFDAMMCSSASMPARRSCVRAG